MLVLLNPPCYVAMLRSDDEVTRRSQELAAEVDAAFDPLSVIQLI
jgi:hypothetical protein